MLTVAITRNPNASEALATLAAALNSLGRHEEALAAFDKILQGEPDDVQTLYNRGVVLSALGREEDAVTSYNRALEVNPHHAQSRLNRAIASAKLKRHAEALSDYDKFLRAVPNDADALNNRGITLAEMGRHDQALTSFERALRVAPHHPDAEHNMARALRKLKRYEEALAASNRLLAANPRDLLAVKGRGRTLLEMKMHEEALGVFARVLTMDPTDGEAAAWRAEALFALHRYEDVLALEEVSLGRGLSDASTLLRKADALRSLGRYTEAVEYYEKGLAVAPEDLNVNVQKAALAISLNALGRDDDADQVMEDVLLNSVSDDAVKWVWSQLCLGRGQFDVGWDLFDSRWTNFLLDAAIAGPRHVRSPWGGEPVDGKLLLWGEQGLGDQILYGSMVPDVVARGHSVILEIDPRLIDLFARSLPGVEFASLSDKPYSGAFEAQLPIGSLGQYFRRDWDAFPTRPQGYLLADAGRARQLRARLSPNGERLIGVSWRSGNLSVGRLKTATLKDFAAILSLPDCRFIDLQYGDTAEERQAIEDELGLKIERLEDIDNTKDLDGLAALMTACDLVVSVSNTNAHLAGALGRPTWVFVPSGHARFWYWFKDKPDSPWYPRARVKPQASGQSWSDVIADALPEISGFLASSRR